MARKVFLSQRAPVLDASGPPTVDSMRKRLGGRMPPASGPFRVGSVVEVRTSTGTERTGVVLAAGASSVDVFLERGIVKRTSTSAVKLYVGATPRELARAAEQAGVFATLFEGQPVHVERGDGPTTPGVLREKCRYGALVETAAGTMLGVGFQRLWPAPKRSTGPA